VIALAIKRTARRAEYTLSHCHKFLRDQHELSNVDRGRRIGAICRSAAANDLEWHHHRIRLREIRSL